jgi:hypothetical protein
VDEIFTALRFNLDIKKNKNKILKLVERIRELIKRFLRSK